MTNSHVTASRTEIKPFTGKADATERTLRALGNVGFTVQRDTDVIHGVQVSTFFHTFKPHVYRTGDKKPEIAALYTDPETGNQVALGMDIVPTHNMNGAYDWTAATTKPGSETGEPLARGGNHDNNQSEMRMQLTALLGAAHFDVAAGSLPTWTAEYQEWEAGISALLDPLYSDSQTPRQ